MPAGFFTGRVITYEGEVETQENEDCRFNLPGITTYEGELHSRQPCLLLQ